MPALHTLDLGDTKLNTLPETCSAQLVELYLNNNFFQKVGDKLHVTNSVGKGFGGGVPP